MTPSVKDNWPWRMRTSTLYLVCAWIVVAVCIAVSISATNDLQLVANWVNFLGATVTFCGFVWAYTKASSDLLAWRARWRAYRQMLQARITGKSLPTPKEQAVGAYGWDAGSAVGQPSVQQQPRNLEEQVALLNRTVERLSDRLSNAEVDIDQVGNAVEQARIEARAGDAQTRAEYDKSLTDFDRRVKRSQELDLRWAIAGVGYSVLGAMLNLCA